MPDVTPPVAALALVIGVDIGNSTTEACIADVGDGEVGRLASSLTRTTGVKGTPDNTTGAVTAVRRALEATGRRAGELATVLLNEATPVISGLAMETITETIITESTMIGHNPDTPGGDGLGVGMTVSLDDLAGVEEEVPVVGVVGAGADFDDVAHLLNTAGERGVDVVQAVHVAPDQARGLGGAMAAQDRLPVAACLGGQHRFRQRRGAVGQVRDERRLADERLDREVAREGERRECGFEVGRNGCGRPQAVELASDVGVGGGGHRLHDGIGK